MAALESNGCVLIFSLNHHSFRVSLRLALGDIKNTIHAFYKQIKVMF
jgi:hypothetical protein